MKKVFDQTVRDLKREVNKKVLKVPGIEQKVLDATSNEPWGPHGSLLSDIAVATRNYHEYQMIMTVIWKRINDTGKNWRHVYKALLVLEYLVANGSERVIDEIREHAYQISALSEFQYIDSSGRDQGNNVRRKSQSLVALVSDKERIIEVRQKAAANREKFRNTPSGGMYRPGTGGYGDRYDEERSEGHFGSREEDRNGYGREREWGNKDDDRYGRYSDPYNRDGDRYGKEYEERYGRDGFREDEFRGRSKSVDDDYPYGSRSRSSDRDRDRSFNDDGQLSSRGSGARAEEHSQDGRKIERKFSEQNIGAPPSYEEVVSESRSPAYNEREAEASTASAPRVASPSANNQLAPSPPTSNNPPSFPSPSHHPSQANNVHGFAASPAKHEVGAADEFDPRGPVPVIPVTNNTETNLLGSLSHALAVVPTTSATTTYEVESHVNSGSVLSSSNISQPFEDPFGEGLFKAAPSADAPQVQSKTFASSDSLPASMDHIAEPPNGGAQKADMGSSFDFGDSLSGITYSTVQTPTNSQSLPQELSATHQNTDILVDILPPSQPGFSALGAQPGQSGGDSFGTYEVQPGAIVPVNMAPQMQSVPASQQGGGNYLTHGGSTMPATSYMVPQITSGSTAYFNSGNFIQQGGFRAPQNGNFYSQQGVFTAPNHGNYYSQVGNQSNQGMMGPTSQFNGGNLLPQQGSAAGVSLQVAHQAPTGPASQHNNMMLGNPASQTGSSTSMAPQQAKDKFEPKSAVWADTLSRGLVNLNISGPKTNPLSDIGVDFDALNRKEKRMEKQPAQTSVASTVTMGKAMGSGSGLGRASAGAVRPNASAMMGSGIGMGMGGGLGVGGYGGMSQTMGGMGINPGMGMNIGMRQGVPMQIPSGLPPGSNMSGYNPMMGPGGNGQQPYGGYR